ncbi:MAG: methyltransferase domain-containing protein [Patescibacteria group bacterium]
MPIFSHNYEKYCDRKLGVILKHIKKEDSVLDAGCGNEHHQYVFLQLSKNYKVTGIDIDNSWNENIIKGDIRNTGFKESSFDVVLCLDVLEHIGNWEEALNELVRVAKKKVIISVPTTENKAFFTIINFFRKIIGINNVIFNGHFRDYFPQQIIELTEKKGLSCQLFKVGFATPFFYPFLLYAKLRYGGIFIINKS